MSIEKINDPAFEDIKLSDYGEDDEEEEDGEAETPFDGASEEDLQEPQEGREKANDGQELDTVPAVGQPTKATPQRQRISTTISMLFQKESEKTDQEPSFSISSDSMEEILPRGSFVLQKKLPGKKDFFQILGHLPDIDQISLPESLKLELMVGSSEDEGEGEGGKGTEAEEHLTDKAKESASTEYSEYEFSSSESEEEDLGRKVSDAHLFDELAKEDRKTAVIIEEFDYEAWQLQEAERQMIRDTQAFLKSLVEYVVEFAEYVDPKTLLRQSLNKCKLFHKLLHLLTDMHVERKVDDFLHRKCVDYYRRQRILRPITPDPVDSFTDEMARCKANYEVLDCLLGQESGIKEISTKRIAELEAEEVELKGQIERETVATEHTIRSIIRRRGSERLNTVVERKIKEMAALRPEISQVRFTLIQRQHTMAKLKQKAADAEDLGDGLYMRDFYRLENENFALEKKLEDHASSLHRIRSRYYAFTDTAAHLRQKQTTMLLALRVQKSTLRHAIMDRDTFREHIHNLKISRIQVKKEIRELSFKNGLIARPVLLVDYDETMEKLELNRAKVEKMKADLEKIDRRIARLQKSTKSA